MIKPEIIFEDNDILVLNKPAGILSIPDRFNQNIPNLISWLGKMGTNVIPVHRIDKFTSGVIVFAKNPETHRLLSIDFEARLIDKYYLAICDGRFLSMKGEINAPLAESTTTRGKMIVHKRGKTSISQYEVIEQFNRFALVEIKIMTGRMHQIRVHLAHIGHPLAVDSLYGKRESLFLSEIKTKRFHLSKYAEEQPVLTRQPLHAARIRFNHPSTGTSVEFSADLPKDMMAILNQLRKWDK